jgi:hypothetical protein
MWNSPAKTGRARLKQEALLFLKKKKQKDFHYTGAGISRRQRPRLNKVFCAAFFQKSGFFLGRLNDGRAEISA